MACVSGDVQAAPSETRRVDRLLDHTDKVQGLVEVIYCHGDKAAQCGLYRESEEEEEMKEEEEVKDPQTSYLENIRSIIPDVSCNLW